MGQRIGYRHYAIVYIYPFLGRTKYNKIGIIYANSFIVLVPFLLRTTKFCKSIVLFNRTQSSLIAINLK